MEKVVDERVVKALKYASETVIPFDADPSGQTYIDASYYFARLIDPEFKIWREKGPDYIVNRKTEKRLIRFYELIRNRSRSQIA